MLKIADMLSNQILPSPEKQILIDTLQVEGKDIVVIDVKRGNDLFYVKKYGRSSTGCYKRVGTSARGMSEKEIFEGMRAALVSKIDICDIPSRQQDCTFRELSIYYASKGFHLNEEMMEKTLKLKTDENKYSLLGELFSDTNSVSIKIARFRGKDKSELDEKSEYGYQCLLRAIDRMTDLLEAENYTKSVIGKARRTDRRLMDMFV